MILAIGFYQCQRDLSYVGNPDNGIPVTPDPITARLQGNVLDENSLPAAGVTITVGTQTATTDAKGYFRINNAPLDKKAALVTAEKAGYFKGYRVFSATSGTNQVVIKLVKKTLVGTINGTSGGEVSLSNGAKISLPANGVVIASNSNAYTGTINVYAAYIDPSATDIPETVPGSFMANDKNNKRVTLSSFGMMAVELQSAAGEKLQVKSGATSTLTTPIPSALQSSAPASISLWSVDEQTGIWKEEGTATKQGNTYVGEVKHYSFWNCDVSVSAVNLSMTIKNSADSLPLVHALVRITRSGTYPTSAYGYTDSLGQVSGLVPSNENLVVAVLDPCHNAIYTQTVGPFTQSTNLGILYVSGASATANIVTVHGNLQNCSGGNVTNGFAIISMNNMAHYAAVDANGNFVTNFITCNNSASVVQIIGVDATTQQQGNVSVVTLAAPSTNAGTITACGTSATQFINYTLDGVSYSVSSSVPADSITAFTGNLQGTAILQTYISGMHQGNYISFRFDHPTAAAGTYPINVIYTNNTSTTSTVIAPSNVTITSYPQSIGQFYIGSFSASYMDPQTSTTHTVTGTFKIRRSV